VQPLQVHVHAGVNANAELPGGGSAVVGFLCGVYSPASRRRVKTRGFAAPAFAACAFDENDDLVVVIAYVPVQTPSRMALRVDSRLCDCGFADLGEPVCAPRHIQMS
jgi:hypothetical protein